MDTFSLVTTIVSRTPVWVWALLAALVALGLMQSRTQVLPRARVVALPAGLGAFAFWGASSAFGLHAWVQAPWLLGAALGVALNLGLRLPREVRALGAGRFEVGGSWAPLGLMLAVFAMRYAVNVTLAIVPALGAMPAFAATVSLLYGLPAGLLAARAARVLAHERLAVPAAVQAA